MTRLPLLFGLLAGISLGVSPAYAAKPPDQPTSGPGGADNPAAEIVKRAVGSASEASYVFYSAGQPQAARPVVVLLHAWGAVDPAVYGGWIDHLARRGDLVIVPSFQTVGRTRPGEATGNTAKLVKSALDALSSDPDARPDLSRLAYIGHSAGAPIAVNLAAGAGETGLPKAKLVFAVMPGGIASSASARGIPLDHLERIDPATALITLIGDRDALASDRSAKRILAEASEVPPSRKLFMRIGSDDHGFPSLSATLASPGSPDDACRAAVIKVPPDPPDMPKVPRPRWSADMVLTGEQTVLLAQLQRNVTDTLDYLGFWKTFDMAAEEAFGRDNLEALKGTQGFLFMGRWSDGWPVRRLSAETPRPAAPEAAAAERAPAAARAPAKLTTRAAKHETRHGRRHSAR